MLTPDVSTRGFASEESDCALAALTAKNALHNKMDAKAAIFMDAPRHSASAHSHVAGSGSKNGVAEPRGTFILRSSLTHSFATANRVTSRDNFWIRAIQFPRVPPLLNGHDKAEIKPVGQIPMEKPMTFSKFTKTGAALALALGLAAPVALSSSAAFAAPHDNMMGGMHMDAMHNHGHRPPMRAEHRPPQPHDGHYRWRTGSWAWHGDHWDWVPGIWIRF
jgi:hypothetical protein